MAFYLKRMFKDMCVGFLTIFIIMVLWFVIGVFEKSNISQVVFIFVFFFGLFSMITITSTICASFPISVSMGASRKNLCIYEILSSVLLTVFITLLSAILLSIFGKYVKLNLSFFIIYAGIFLATTGLSEFSSSIIITTSHGKIFFTVFHLLSGLIFGLLGSLLGFSSQRETSFLNHNFANVMSLKTALLTLAICIAIKIIFSFIFVMRIKKYEYK